MSLIEKIRHWMSCCPSRQNLVLTDASHSEAYEDVIISNAPEPEDILWENLGVREGQKLIRSLGTYFVTVCLLGISLGIVYLLSIEQLKNSGNFTLSILISLTISILNSLMGFLIRFLTYFERHYTATGYQTSLAVKTILAQVINSIVVPLIANYFIEWRNLYQPNGLATDVFYISIINSFLPPLLKIIHPSYCLLRLQSHYFRGSLKSQLLMSQQQLNTTQELMEF